MECDQVYFTGHAIRRMFERTISRTEVMQAVRFGEVVVKYADDEPFPSFLMLGQVDDRHFHVVVAIEEESKTCYIVTVYVPDPEQWEADFKTRRAK
jgi:hypothetical protein